MHFKLIEAIGKRKNHSQRQHFRNISQYDFEKDMKYYFINEIYLWSRWPDFIKLKKKNTGTRIYFLIKLYSVYLQVC